jgi:hypothetical protein
MASGRGGKRWGGPWYGDERRRVLFERGARRIPGLRGATISSGARAGRVYSVSLEVPHYERRRVEVRFPKATPTLPHVIADGPTNSPHRYGNTRLCMWHPDDCEQRWELDDGLLVLLGMTSAHLFREAWWRETGEWLGPEAPHGELKPEDD